MKHMMMKHLNTLRLKFSFLDSEDAVPYAILLSVFVLLHLGFYVLLGGKFLYDPMGLWQIVDLDLLRNRPCETLFYLHIQPPLFNAYIALIEICFQSFAKVAHQILFVLLGFCSLICIYHLLILFRVSRYLALGLTLYALCSPSWILFEHWSMYTFPVMCCLSISAVLCHRMVSHSSIPHGIWFCTTLAALVYTRSIFHIGWFVAVLAILFSMARFGIVKMLKMAGLPLLVVLVLYTKNWLVFGSFSASSWLGPNLLTMTYSVPVETRAKLLVEQKISLINLSNPFLPLEKYRNKVDIDFDKKTGIPVLDEPYKHDGQPNYNHRAYLELHNIQSIDAISLIQASPTHYWSKVKESFARFFQPPWNFSFFMKQPAKVHKAVEAFNRYFLFYVQETWPAQEKSMRENLPVRFITLYLPVLIVLSAVAVFHPSNFLNLSTADRAVLLYGLLTTIVVIVAGSCMLPHENNRLQFNLTPFTVLLLGVWIKFMVNVARKNYVYNLPTRYKPPAGLKRSIKIKN